MEVSFDKQKRDKLVQLLKCRPAEMNQELTKLKLCREKIKEPQFLWIFLLQGAATLGGNRGADHLFGDPKHMESLTFDKLAAFSDKSALIDHLEGVFKVCKFRYAQKKAQEMAYNVDLINKMGGAVKVGQMALKLKGKRVKMKFIQKFKGVGAKYGRNFWMDIYDPDFYDAIALDERVAKVSKALQIDEDEPYNLRERFYLQIAKEAGLQGWELDRLLFNFNDYFIKALF